MSTVAIFVTNGTIFAGSAAMSSACLAMGIGVGAAFYLHFRHEIRQQERQILTRALENACYRVRQRIESLPAVLQEQYANELNNLRLLEDSATTAIAADDLCAIPAAITALQKQYAELRQQIEPALIALREPSTEILDTAISLRDRLARHLGLPQLAPLSAELRLILEINSAEDMMPAIEALAFRADQLIRQHQQNSGIQEEQPPAVDAPGRKEQRLNTLAVEARRFHLLITRYDQAAADAVEPLVEELAKGASEQRHQMIRDTIRLKYGVLKEAAASTAIYREILTPLPDQVRHLPCGANIAVELEALLNNSCITTEEYQEALRKSHDLLFRSAEELALLRRVRDTLEQLGYTTVPNVADITEKGLLAGEVFFVETKWEGYRVMLRLSAQGELLTRLVRIVADENEKQRHSSYQRQKDQDVARRWCGDYDRFMAALTEQGVACSVNLRKAPDEEEVLCIVDASFQRRGAATSTSADSRKDAIK